MLLAGDEFGRTQRGNNNAYCQDDETSWLEWRMLETDAGHELHRFVRKLIALRQEHTALRSRHFLHGRSEIAPDVFDIAWFEANGELVPESSWKNPEIRLLCLRRAMPKQDSSLSLLALFLNPAESFTLPPRRFRHHTDRTAKPEVQRAYHDQKVTVQRAHRASPL
jgi:glycogen operon protein